MFIEYLNMIKKLMIHKSKKKYKRKNIKMIKKYYKKVEIFFNIIV